MKQIIHKIQNGLHQRVTHHKANTRWQDLIQQVNNTPLDESQSPVIFFNASTRLEAMSQNAAYSLLTALMLRLKGIPIIQFVCNAGLDRCVLGSHRDDFDQNPPCKRCVHQSQVVFKGIPTKWFELQEEPLDEFLEGLTTNQLSEFTREGKPLGFWAVNSVRWMLRRHHLLDDARTRSFLRAYILSAWNVYHQFSALLLDKKPRAAVLFNGMFYPEAAAKFACEEKGVRVITHEVGLRPYSAFFTSGEATAYPVHINANFQLNSEMNTRLDDYLEKRFKGKFSMAGVQFWPEMKKLDESFLAYAAKFKKIVPVFTNVIFDTSQVHANTLFEHMFAWLDYVHASAIKHPEILFVIRSHPDETRPGKESRESVAQWVKQTGIKALPNVLFVEANEFISSYELIQRSHLVMVYNSTIGLEASIMGKAVITGGKARFTQLATSFFHETVEEYKIQLEKLLSMDLITVPAEFQQNARRFLYYQLYATSLDFSSFLEEDGVWKGYVQLKRFTLDTLTLEKNETVKVLVDGILNEGDFCYPL